MIYLHILIVVILLVMFIVITPDKPYTDDEWDALCERDFKKSGTVPDESFTVLAPPL